MIDQSSPTTRPSAQAVRLIVIIGLLCFLSGALVGLVAGQRSPLRTLPQAIAQLTGGRSSADYQLLSDAWQLIQSRYVNRPVNDTQLVRGSVRGLIEGLGDPYSFYLAPDESSSFVDELNGKFEGIGAELGVREKQIVVIAPLPDSPAAKAGLVSGTKILAIEDASTEGMVLEEAVRRIRGQEGTKVRLEVQLPGATEPSTMELTRARIQLQSLSYKVVPKHGTSVAVVRITSFTQSTSREFNLALQKIALDRPAGIVLDLRNNPGGYLDAATQVADAFLRDGPIVIEDFGHGQRETIDANADAPLDGLRTVVVVNGGSASAAEILAGALHDRLGAPVVGATTFGKGSVQEIERLNDGSTVKLTVAHWLTPNGTSIDGRGIVPSEPIAEVKDTDLALERAVELAAGQ